MKAYLDTSALVKLYYPEEESKRLSQWIIRNNEPIPYTSFHDLEFHNALGLKVFRKEMGEGQRTSLKKTLNDDLRNGVLVRPAVLWGEVFSQASKLSDAYTSKLGCRSMDILHVACALRSDYSHFLTFDDRQAALAKKTGLRLISLQ